MHRQEPFAIAKNRAVLFIGKRTTLKNQGIDLATLLWQSGQSYRFVAGTRLSRERRRLDRTGADKKSHKQETDNQQPVSRNTRHERKPDLEPAEILRVNPEILGCSVPESSGKSKHLLNI